MIKFRDEITGRLVHVERGPVDILGEDYEDERVHIVTYDEETGGISSEEAIQYTELRIYVDQDDPTVTLERRKWEDSYVMRAKEFLEVFERVEEEEKEDE
jgi:hypothetical protein